MIFYLITFLLCFLLDNRTVKKKHSYVFIIGGLWIFCFLCFGYMCGSDWRQYERDYVQETYSDYEIGSYIVFEIFCKFGVDFWLFTGLFKVLFLYSLLLLASTFTEKKWSVVGIEFIIGSLLLMLISCPFRYMLSTTALLFSIFFYLKNKKVAALFLLCLSCTFHAAFIINVLLILSYFVLHRFVNKLSSTILVISYCVFFYVVGTLPIFKAIYNYLIPILDFSNFVEGYGEANMDNLFTFGNIKEFFLFILVIIFRKDILNCKYGKILLYFALLSSFLYVMLKCIPVGGRFNIVNKIFLSIAFSEIIYMRFIKPNFKLFFKLVMCACFFVTFYNMYNGVVYIPYSNSIPYIIMGHKPLTEREEFNIKAYHERTGKTYDPYERNF